MRAQRGGRTRAEVERILTDVGARAVKAETVIREALTALRVGRTTHALEVLEDYENARQDEADARRDPR